MRRKALVLAGMAAIYLVWPYVVTAPALQAEAQRDIADEDATPVDRLRKGDDGPLFIPVGKVVTLRDGTRIRPVADSHHNWFISYSGTTYVKIEERLYRRDEGHCAPVIILPRDPCESGSSLEKWLLEGGYDEVGRR